jgi:hypothetical protein
LSDSHERVDTQIVPIQRGIPGREFADDVKDMAFALWSTFCNGDAAATERMLRRELGEGEPVPTAQTIRNWARGEDWRSAQAAGWRSMAKRSAYELRRVMIANVMLAQKIKRDVMTGAYTDDVANGALVLKGAELADRLLERAVIALSIPDEPDEPPDDADLTREAREAQALSAMAQRKARRRGE